MGGGHNHTCTYGERGRGDPWVLGQVIYSVHPFPHFNNLSLCKPHKRDHSLHLQACTSSFSEPLAHLPQPLHVPSHLLVSLPSYSLLCAVGRCLADLARHSGAFWHQPAHGEVRRMMEGAFGMAKWERDLTSIKWRITSAFVLRHTHTQIMRSNGSDQQPISPLRPPDKGWNLVAHYIST